jgi:putative acyl-CoA dehydrogenase
MEIHMETQKAPAERSTHEVINQSVPLEPINHYLTNLSLQESISRDGGAWGEERLIELGRLAGLPEQREHCRRAETNLPVLMTHDRFGNRLDEVELDPSWHHLLGTAIEHQCHSLAWTDERPGSHVVRAGLFMLWSNTNGGVMCPVSMTHAVVPPLRNHAPEIAAEWEERLTVPDYEKGVIAGMFMTEKQGGSDVRANSTQAVPVGGDEYELTGHKWFCSYPPCDFFLVLAQAPGGLSCFFVERGEGLEFQRLKEKLGTRSLPSAEAELRAVRGRLVGEEGRGVPSIIEMVNQTRLDCIIGSAASMRRGLLEAVHHARHRSAFGALLVDQPAMQNVLADLAIESEAATVAMTRVAKAFDDEDAALSRFGTAVMKYWVCKRAPGHAFESLECLGGNGFVEDSGMPLIFRDSGVSSIWEGSGNVAALDVLRAMVKEPEGMPALIAECELARGADKRFDDHLDSINQKLGSLYTGDIDADIISAQFAARSIVEDLAVAFQASLLLRDGPDYVADAFCAGRLGQTGRAYGTLPNGIDAKRIVDRVIAD